MIFADFYRNNLHPLLKLVWPMSITALLSCSIFFFNTLFLAKLGADILAAGALGSYLTGTIVVVAFGIFSSVNVLVAHQFGAKNHQQIALIIKDGIILTILLAIPTIILLWYISPILLLFGQKEKIVTIAVSYLHAWAWGILPQFLIAALIELFIGLGRMRIIMVIMVLSVSLSVFLSYILIFGQLGMPVLGIAGAGLSISLCNWIVLIGLIIFIFFKKDIKGYFIEFSNSKRPIYLKDLLQIGVPMGLMYGLEVGFFFALTLFMGGYGANVLAANQIAMQYNNLIISIIFSIAQAVTVRMGHLMGAGKVMQAKTAGITGVMLSSILLLLAATVFWFSPLRLIGIDIDIMQSKNAGIIHYATQFLAVCALFQIFEGARITFFGALRALKDTRFTLCISIFSFWIIALPIGYFLATQVLKAEVGLWWGMVLGAIFSVLILAWRFNQKIQNYPKNLS